MWVYPRWTPLQPYHVCNDGSIGRSGIVENGHSTWTIVSIANHSIVRIKKEVQSRLAVEQDPIRGDINVGEVECLPSILKLLLSISEVHEP